MALQTWPITPKKFGKHTEQPFGIGVKLRTTWMNEVYTRTAKIMGIQNVEEVNSAFLYVMHNGKLKI